MKELLDAAIAVVEMFPEDMSNPGPKKEGGWKESAMQKVYRLRKAIRNSKLTNNIKGMV